MVIMPMQCWSTIRLTVCLKLRRAVRKSKAGRKKERERERLKERWKQRWKERCLVNKVLSTTSPGESTLPYPLRLDIFLSVDPTLSLVVTRGEHATITGGRPRNLTAPLSVSLQSDQGSLFFSSIYNLPVISQTCLQLVCVVYCANCTFIHGNRIS